MDTAYWVRVALNESASCQTSDRVAPRPHPYTADTDTDTDTDTLYGMLRYTVQGIRLTTNSKRVTGNNNSIHNGNKLGPTATSAPSVLYYISRVLALQCKMVSYLQDTLTLASVSMLLCFFRLPSRANRH